MEPQAALQTRRLDLEPLSPHHARPLFPLLRDASLYVYLDLRPPSTVAELEAQYALWGERRSPDGTQRWLNWAARLRDGGGYAGWFQSTVFDDERADIAYMVFAPFQRTGIAFEACSEIVQHLRERYGVAQVGATIDERNVASIALARRLGLRLAPARPTPTDLRYEM